MKPSARGIQTLVSVLTATATAWCQAAAEELPAPAARDIDFARDIAPIFEAHCRKCHGADKQKGGYRLDARQIALHRGEHSPGAQRGQPADPVRVGCG